MYYARFLHYYKTEKRYEYNIFILYTIALNSSFLFSIIEMLQS